MDIDITKLMILFDDFDEKIDFLTNEKYYRFICRRQSNEIELLVFNQSERFFLSFKDEETIVHSIKLNQCGPLRVNLETQTLYITSGYEQTNFIECVLVLKDNFQILINTDQNHH